MYTPHQATWYSKSGATYTRYEIPACMWQASKAINSLKIGHADADRVNVWVPGDYAFKPGDYLVKGIVSDVVTTSPSVLTNKYPDCIKITVADRKDYGSPDMRHWQVQGS
jgi:hypothetical protein